MSYEQKLLKGMSENPLTPDACSRLIRALDAIPEVFHSDFLSAYFKEQEPEENPENYAVVKTFDSPEFHVGDEVTEGIKKGVVISTNENSMRVIESSGSIVGFDPFTSWNRTGRNFPAIPAILEELKKA